MTASRDLRDCAKSNQRQQLQGELLPFLLSRDEQVAGNQTADRVRVLRPAGTLLEITAHGRARFNSPQELQNPFFSRRGGASTEARVVGLPALERVQQT